MKTMVIPKDDSLWRHHTGRMYRVLLIANRDSTRPEYPITVVYRGTNQKIWSKPLSNFLEKMTWVED